MSLVAAFDLICHSADVTNAFLNAPMKEEVYVKCPPGFDISGEIWTHLSKSGLACAHGPKSGNFWTHLSKSGLVWKLKRALYGLKSAPKLWFEELTKFMLDKGYVPCPDEPCLLINHKTGVMVFFYVDDFLLIAPKQHEKEIEELKKILNDKYGIKDLGPTTSFLNIEVIRDRQARTLWLSQESYINKLITKFNLQSMLAHQIHTPLTPGFKARLFSQMRFKTDQ
jgi:hypothetical protein